MSHQQSDLLCLRWLAYFVVSIPEGRADVPEFVSVFEPTMKMKHHHQSAQSISIDEDSWIASSASGTHLYLVTLTLDTDYLLKNASGC